MQGSLQAPPHLKPSPVGEGVPHRDSLEGPELQVSEVLSQFPSFQVIKKQGHFALFAQAWAVRGGWGARATRAQAGGKEGQGIGGAQGGGCGGVKGDGRVGVGREEEGADSQIGGVSQAPLGGVALLLYGGPEATYNLF